MRNHSRHTLTGASLLCLTLLTASPALAMEAVGPDREKTVVAPTPPCDAAASQLDNASPLIRKLRIAREQRSQIHQLATCARNALEDEVLKPLTLDQLLAGFSEENGLVEGALCMEPPQKQSTRQAKEIKRLKVQWCSQADTFEELNQRLIALNLHKKKGAEIDTYGTWLTHAPTPEILKDRLRLTEGRIRDLGEEAYAESTDAFTQFYRTIWEEWGTTYMGRAETLQDFNARAHTIEIQLPPVKHHEESDKDRALDLKKRMPLMRLSAAPYGFYNSVKAILTPQVLDQALQEAHSPLRDWISLWQTEDRSGKKPKHFRNEELNEAAVDIWRQLNGESYWKSPLSGDSLTKFKTIASLFPYQNVSPDTRWLAVNLPSQVMQSFALSDEEIAALRLAQHQARLEFLKIHLPQGPHLIQLLEKAIADRALCKDHPPHTLDTFFQYHVAMGETHMTPPLLVFRAWTNVRGAVPTPADNSAAEQRAAGAVEEQNIPSWGLKIPHTPPLEGGLVGVLNRFVVEKIWEYFTNVLQFSSFPKQSFPASSEEDSEGEEESDSVPTAAAELSRVDGEDVPSLLQKLYALRENPPHHLYNLEACVEQSLEERILRLVSAQQLLELFAQANGLLDYRLLQDPREVESPRILEDNLELREKKTIDLQNRWCAQATTLEEFHQKLAELNLLKKKDISDREQQYRTWAAAAPTPEILEERLRILEEHIRTLYKNTYQNVGYFYTSFCCSARDRWEKTYLMEAKNAQVFKAREQYLLQKEAASQSAEDPDSEDSDSMTFSSTNIYASTAITYGFFRDIDTLPTPQALERALRDNCGWIPLWQATDGNAKYPERHQDRVFYDAAWKLWSSLRGETYWSDPQFGSALEKFKAIRRVSKRAS